MTDGNLPVASQELRERAESIKDAAAEQLRNAAANIRSEVADQQSDLSSQAEELARGMERAATYLSNNTFDQIGDDVAESVRRNPWRAISIVFVVGLIIGVIIASRRG